MNQVRGSRWRSTIVIVSLCMSVVAASAAWRAPAAMTSPPPAPPTAVAIVNLKTLLDGLTEFKEGMDVIAAEKKASEGRIEEVKAQLKKAQQDLDMLKDPPLSDRIKLQARIAELQELGETRAAVLTRVLEVQAGDLMRRVFLKSVDAGDRLAAKDGWDLILIDDRSIVPPERAGNQTTGRRIRVDEVEQIIQQRRILSASKRVDITASLIEFMNAEYKAGKK